jgi:hypothetical protein
MGMHREFRSYVGWVKNLRFIDFHDALGRGPVCRPAPPCIRKYVVNRSDYKAPAFEWM